MNHGSFDDEVDDDLPDEGLGDEGLGRRYGPERLALWFDELKRPRDLNEPLVRARRLLIRSEIWRRYEYDEIPLIPEWFGMLLPFERALRESGHLVIWCLVLGFPRRELRDLAAGLIEAERPPGLLRIDRDAPDPKEYHLPLAGFLAKDAYLTLSPETPRHYDHWRGYDTLGLVSDDDAGLMEFVDTDSAERMLIRRLALSAGRWFGKMSHRSELSALVDHARELWALETYAAAGAVAGTAMEVLLRETLMQVDQPWMLGTRRTLGPLIDRAVSKHGLGGDQRTVLHEFRELRNQCAHALDDGQEQQDDAALRARLDVWLAWLESQPGEGSLVPVMVARTRPGPKELHREADAAGRKAAEDTTPTPVWFGSEVVTEGLIGGAVVVIRPAGDPLAEWLVAQGRARISDGQVRMGAYSPTLSIERAAAYAREYVLVLSDCGISGHYETRLD